MSPSTSPLRRLALVAALATAVAAGQVLAAPPPAPVAPPTTGGLAPGSDPCTDGSHPALCAAYGVQV